MSERDCLMARYDALCESGQVVELMLTNNQGNAWYIGKILKVGSDYLEFGSFDGRGDYEAIVSHSLINFYQIHRVMTYDGDTKRKLLEHAAYTGELDAKEKEVPRE